MDKHTPGPWGIPCAFWSASFDGYGPKGGYISAMRPTGRFLRGEDGNFYPEPPTSGTNICSTIWQDMSKAEYVANTNLIAAAPDLLEALRYAEAFISIAAPQYARDRDEAINEVLPQVRAAIAKATGVSP